jgi:hypothetical protein
MHSAAAAIWAVPHLQLWLLPSLPVGAALLLLVGGAVGACCLAGLLVRRGGACCGWVPGVSRECKPQC